MPCLIVLLLLGLPRVVLMLMWLFSSPYLSRAFAGHANIVPFLGFLFLPFTTLAYTWSQNTYGAVQGLGLAAIVVGLLLDLGLIGASRRRRA
jgi:hypothetical protein